MTEESQHTQSFIFVFAILALSVGMLSVIFSDNGITGLVIYGNGSSCNESWVEQFTDCGLDDTKIKYYVDDNNCDQGEVPVDNGTSEACDFCVPSPVRINGTCNNLNTMPIFSVDELGCFNLTGLASDAVDANISSSTCDFCVPTWSSTESACEIDNTKTITYLYTNTCCADTALDSDCTLPNPVDNATCDNCVPDWDRETTDCLDNEYTVYYVDDHDCFSLTNLTSDIEGQTANETVSCDSCVPEWIPLDSACEDNKYVTFQFDTQECGESENAPANVTHTCVSAPVEEVLEEIILEPVVEEVIEVPEEVIDPVVEEPALVESTAEADVLVAADGEGKESTSAFTGRIINTLGDKSGLLTYSIAFIILIVGFLAYLVTIKYGHHIHKIVPSSTKIDKSARKYFLDIKNKLELPSRNYIEQAKQKTKENNSSTEVPKQNNVKPAQSKRVFGKKKMLSKDTRSIKKLNSSKSKSSVKKVKSSKK